MTASENKLANQMQAAASALTESGNSPEASELLRHLGYDDGDAAAAPGRARLLRAATGFRRLFRLAVPDAPGLVFLGAEADPVSLGPHNAGLPVIGFAGSGLDLRRAFESCVGEGIEYLSQFSEPEELLDSAPIDACSNVLDAGSYRFVNDIASACGIPADRVIEWVSMQRLADGASFRFPADLCLRRAAPDFVPPLKLSTGCAAGVTRESATLRGMLELIERDAVALWWRGGNRGRQVSPG